MNNSRANYEQAPPSYEEEASHPLMEGGGEETEVMDDMFKETVANSSREIRMQFVRKVYSILTVQLLGTVIMSAIYMNNLSARNWVQNNPWMLFVSMFGSLAVLFTLMWKGRSAPLNYYLLSIFTLFESHMVGTVVTFYDKTVVFQALLITFAVFFALTLFTFQSKWDFSGMGPLLFAGIWILLISGVVSMFFPKSETSELVFGVAGVIIFSGYIIFDTYLIFNRHSPEDYILASTSLYLDIINLFLRVLQIMNGTYRR